MAAYSWTTNFVSGSAGDSLLTFTDIFLNTRNVLAATAVSHYVMKNDMQCLYINFLP